MVSRSKMSPAWVVLGLILCLAAYVAFGQTDEFPSQAGIDSPARRAAAVTPHDSTMLSYVTRGIYVGGAGNVAVLTAGGDTVVFTAVPAGTLLPLRVNRVNSTNTTATAIVAIW